MERQTVVRKWTDRTRLTEVFEGKDMTQQSHAESCDVNSIVTRFQRTGEMPREREGFYDDVTGLQVELTEAYNRSRETLDAAIEQSDRLKAEAAKPKPEENAGASPDPEPTTE